MLSYRKNKKAQVGETVSWLVATLVVVGILIIFLYLSVLMSKVKVIDFGNLNSDFKENFLFEKKTFFAEQINSENKEIIEEILKNENK